MFRDAHLFDDGYLAKRSCDPRTLEQVTLVALELAREEPWMLRQFGTQISGRVSQHTAEQVAVVSKEE